MSRVFLMKWYHFSVEYFEDLRNINHCELLIMSKKEENGKYQLDTKLRTWSELRREREKERAKSKADEAKDVNGHFKDGAKLDRALSAPSPVTAPRRWGGCPNGCDHDKNFKIRAGFADLVKRDGTATNNNENSSPATNGNTITAPSSLGTRRPAARRFQTSVGNSDDEGDDEGDSEGKGSVPQIDITRAREEVVSSPDATPSFITVDDRLRAQKLPPRPFLHIGRDFGGTYSGHTSDADSSEDDGARWRRGLKVNGPSALAIHGGKETSCQNHHHQHHHHHPSSQKRDLSSLGSRLGDSSYCSDCDNEGQDDSDTTHGHKGHAAAAAAAAPPAKAQLAVEDEEIADITEEEREDRSIQGSVY